ncbi:MAG: hypothetical protein NWE89_04995 [Candidatus Bathyarchaeota archaeon]|nr:hypothetical protein [Candidatus Bathyarchaeota archaeon]
MSVQLKLSGAEKRVYNLVQQGDVMCRQIPPRDRGAVQGLLAKGLIEVYSKRVSKRRDRKLKFIRKK